MRRLALLALVSLPAIALSQPTDTTRYTILMAKGPSGVQKAWTDSTGARVFYFEYNDRGRGPAITQRVTLRPDGFPLTVEISGHDYLKAPVSEHFVVEQSGAALRARWKNGAESTSVALTRPAFYLGMNDAAVGILERLLLTSPTHRVALLPQGEARAERIRDLTLSGDTPKKVTLWALHGFGFSPSTWWADESGETFATGGSWFMIIKQGFESAPRAES
jgi:hypothetical protein